VSVLVDIIAWLVLGAIAGYIAGFFVSGDEGLGCLGRIVLGIVGAVVGGFIVGALGFNTGRDDGDILNLASIIVAVFGAVVVVFIANRLRGERT
jgi:uncharacterized membrane protein YeaQ/YmgE (transglycosylase-associated protein family)